MSNMVYQYEANMVLSSVSDGIYKIFKDKHGTRRGAYITSSDAITHLNNIEKVAIYDNRHVFLHANFKLGES